MSTQLLGYAAVRARAETRRTGTVPPLALVVKVAATADLSHPSTLLERCVVAGALTHPILDRLFLAAGARLDGRSYLVPASTVNAPSHATVHALSAAHPGTWRSIGATHRISKVHETFGAPLIEALTAAGAAPTTGKPKRLAGMSLRVSRTGARLKVTPTTEGLTLAGHTLLAGAAGRLHLTPPQALDLIRAAQDAGVVVLAENPDDLASLEALVDASCVVHPTHAAPGWAQLVSGKDVNVPTLDPVPALDALTLAEEVAATGALVTIHPHVASVAAATKAADTPADTPRPGLHPWQDAFVSTYLACGPGMVNALPPGAGKTVCAATAMRERASTTMGYRGVVLVPATLRSQWSRELARFFPEADVCVAESTATLNENLTSWSTCTLPRVLILTPQLLARSDDAQRLPSHDLVVDEANYLSNRETATAAAAWGLRGHAEHCMVLTGTPDQRGADSSGELLAFARNTPDEFSTLTYAADHPLVRYDRAGVLLFTGPGDVSENLPQASPTPILLEPTDVETHLTKLARERVAQLLEPARPSALRLRTEIEAWRLGLASPVALLASQYGLATAAREAGIPATLGAKGEWVVARTLEGLAGAGQVLIFSDFAAALTPLAGHLDTLDVRAAVVSSASHTRERERAVDAFTRGEIQVLLIAAAGQLGLNLQSAATVLHLDVPTSAATLKQRSARAARLGSTYANIEVVVPVVAGTADETLFTRLLDPTAGNGSVDLGHALTA